MFVLSRSGFLIAAFVLLCLIPLQSQALDGQLSENILIDSEELGYALQYRVYVPEGYEELSDLSTIYLTDGQWYISGGDLAGVMDELARSASIAPTIAVFVDNRDPYELSDNRRNRQFFCNERYAAFFEQELIPAIDAAYKTAATRESRAVMGLSFGGLNAACFGLDAHESFGGIAMQSPAIHPVRDLFARYAEAPKRDLKIFLSTGTKNDNQDRTRRLKKILEEKGYSIHYVEVAFGHTWDNWAPLLDDALVYFFGTNTLPR